MTKQPAQLEEQIGILNAGESDLLKKCISAQNDVSIAQSTIVEVPELQEVQPVKRTDLTRTG